MPEPREKSANKASAGLPATLVLTLSVTAGIFLLLLAPVYLLLPTTPMPEPLPPQHQNAETLLFGLLILAGVATVLLLPRRLDQWASAHSPAAADLLAACAAGGLGLLVVLARLAHHLAGRNLLVVLGLSIIWWLVMVAIFAKGGEGLRALAAGPGRGRILLLAATAAVAVGLLAPVTFAHLNGVPLLVCLALAGLGTWLWGRVRLPVLRGWKGFACDLLLIALVLLAVPDIPIYRVGDLASQPVDSYLAEVMVFHGNLYLGAANAILHGSHLLVDEVSQYGVGSIYLLAALFELIPIDYGTLSLIDAVLSAVVFAAGYLILRMAGTGRLLGLGAMAVTVIVLAWGLTFPIGGIVQNGAIRFGLLPVSLVFFRIASIRLAGGGRAGLARVSGWLAWAVVGLSAIWALEALLYTTATLTGLVLAEAMTRPPGSRRRWILGRVVRALIAWAGFHLAFAIYILIAAGQLPDWGMYISYLRDFLVGKVGDLTYDFEPWSPGLLVGFGYLASATATALAIWRRRDWFDANQVAFIALAGLSLYGLIQFSYFDNRSLATILPFLCFPLLLSATIWLDLIQRDPGAGPALRRGAVAVALTLAAVTVSTVWPDARERSTDTALAYALPGGRSLADGLERLGDMPPLTGGADEGERLLRKYMPGESESAVATRYDLDLNILIRADRANRLGIADANEASWVPGPHVPVMEEAVDSLASGDRMLVDQGALRQFSLLQQDPEALPDEFTTDDGQTVIQLMALARIGRRFDLKTVARGSDGLEVVELVPRGSGDELAGGKDPRPVQDQAESGP